MHTSFLAHITVKEKTGPRHGKKLYELSLLHRVTLDPFKDHIFIAYHILAKICDAHPRYSMLPDFTFFFTFLAPQA